MSPYRVSHETIYRSLFIQARGALKKELTLYLRSKRTIRRSPHATHKGRGGGQIRDLISISERPASVEDRAVPGHWEGDLLAGSKNSYIATLVERHSRYVMLVKVSGKDTETVISASDRARPGNCRANSNKSLTWEPWTGDGRSQALHPSDGHRLCTSAIHRVLGNADRMRTPTDCCRQYFPKGTDLSLHSQEHLDSDRSQAERSAPSRRWSLKLQQNVLALVLHRPVEPTGLVGSYIGAGRYETAILENLTLPDRETLRTSSLRYAGMLRNAARLAYAGVHEIHSTGPASTPSRFRPSSEQHRSRPLHGGTSHAGEPRLRVGDYRRRQSRCLRLGRVSPARASRSGGRDAAVAHRWRAHLPRPRGSELHCPRRFRW